MVSSIIIVLFPSLPTDVILECLGFQWELHRMYLSKSQVLSNLLAEAIEQDGSGDTEPKDKTVKGIGRTSKNLCNFY